MEDNELDLKKENNTAMSVASYLIYLIIFFVPYITTLICLSYFKCGDKNIFNKESFYIIIAIAIINVLLTAIYFFKESNISKKNLAKSFLIIGCLMLILEIFNINKFKPDEYIISKLNEGNSTLFGPYKLEHIKGSDLKNIIENIDDDQYNVPNFNVDEIDKDARYTIVIDEGYIDTIVVTEIE